MISTSNLTVAFGKRVLFNQVSIKFSHGNCYGLIGANGSGKSTFLKVLSGEIEANEGAVHVEPGKRLAVLKQDQTAFDAHRVLDTVIMGHQIMFQLMQERDALYAKPDFSEADGIPGRRGRGRTRGDECLGSRVRGGQPAQPTGYSRTTSG